MTRHLVLGNTARGTPRVASVLAGLARPRAVGKCIRPSGQVPRLVAALDARWLASGLITARSLESRLVESRLIESRLIESRLIGARLVAPLSVAPVVVAVIAPVVAVIVPAVVAVAPIVPIVRPV